MKLTRRILLVVAIVIVVALLSLRMTPVVLSYYEAHHALPITRVVPTELKDVSVSQAPGKKLSFFGYEFDVPWTDLDDTQTKLYPRGTPCRADVRFRSGLHVIVTAVRPREWVDGLAVQAKVSPERIQAAYGKTDYDIVRTVLEFSPESMHYWNAKVLAREQFLLILKTVAPLRFAQSGIFNIRNSDFKGFQEGSPQVRQDGIAVHLFHEEGSIEFIFFQKDYQVAAGITQPEINRIIQSVRKVSQNTTTTAANVQ